MISRIINMVKGFIYGATTYDYVIELRSKEFQYECLLQAIVLGDRYGIPSSHYYRLKLLPYWVTKLKHFDREILREKDILEKI
ncbi:MAG: hypothetical protein QW290_09960 [Sulfolobales archaeon]